MANIILSNTNEFRNQMAVKFTDQIDKFSVKAKQESLSYVKSQNGTILQMHLKSSTKTLIQFLDDLFTFDNMLIISILDEIFKRCLNETDNLDHRGLLLNHITECFSQNSFAGRL